MSHPNVRPVRTRRDLRAFLHLPWTLYRGDPYWVPPLLGEQRRLLDARRHPFWKRAQRELFLAERDGRLCGRVAAIRYETHDETHHERAGFFGFFESSEDEELAHALLRAAADWTRVGGAEVFRGPYNPSVNYECGLLVEGFNAAPRIMMTYNPPFYAEFFESFGLRKARDLYAYWLDRRLLDMEAKVFRVAERAAERAGVRIRDINLRDFEREAQRILSIYNTAWQPHWGFVPMSDAEFRDSARRLKQIVRPEFVYIAEVEKSKVERRESRDESREHGPAGLSTLDSFAVGFLLAIPDIYQILPKLNGRLFPFGFVKLLRGLKKIDVLRVPILGVLPAYQNAGVAARLYLELMNRALALGIDAVEMSWVLEDNAMMNRAAEMLKGRRYKTYRLYEMALAAAAAGRG